MNRLASRRILFAVFVAVALAAIYASAGLRHPVAAASQTASRPVQAPVVTALRACAAPGENGPGAGSLALASVPGPGAPAGEAVVRRLVPGGSTGSGPLVTTLTRPAVLALTPVKTAAPLPKRLLASQPGSSPEVRTSTGRGGVVVSATGAMAQGLAVEQTGPAGLVTAQCGSPGTSFWFVGPGAADAADIELYLMNTDDKPADAQVSIITDVTKTLIPAGADSSITVPPHSMVTQGLGTLLASSKVIALNVTTSVGRVVAAVRESKSRTAGGGWLPATQAPARSIYIPGLPATGGSRVLYLVVPTGTATAQVKVTAVTPRGSYQPTGGSDALLSGSAAILPLPALDFVSGAIRVSSTVPVVATMMIAGGSAGAPGAVAVGTGPVQEQGVLADSPVGVAGTTEVILSAPGRAATVRVAVAAAGTPASGQAGIVVPVRAGRSVIVPVRNPGGKRVTAVTIVVTPLAGSGPVYAGRLVSHGGVVESILPVPTSPTWVLMPSVPGSLAAVAP